MLFKNETKESVLIRNDKMLPNGTIQNGWRYINAEETVELPEDTGIAKGLTPMTKEQNKEKPKKIKSEIGKIGKKTVETKKKKK